MLPRSSRARIFCLALAARVVSLPLALLLEVRCVPQDGWGESAPEPELPAPVNAAWADNYERRTLGANYLPTYPAYRLVNGELCVAGSKNHPLWLKRPLPENVRIEFDARSDTSEGDIKVELFGDGRSFARTSSYTDASGYLIIFGGWRNRFHVLARQNEHAPERLEQRLTLGAENPAFVPLRAGRSYHIRLERRGGRTLRVWLDGALVFTLVDRNPLTGKGHQHFAFNNWEAPVCFDNLKIAPL
ncbi:MAG: hypothetical protein SFV15_24215 [Polyangiaceae bacterium]|nr:hypothetical protein [Polyangiaceae bacterium]